MYWYAAQAANEKWGAMGMTVWALISGVWILATGLLVALLQKRIQERSKEG